MFGIQYVPVKKYEIHDGSLFQYHMAGGILITGFIINLCLSFPLPILLPGLLGGAFWGVSNYLVLPTVRFLGLGLGFTLYHAVNLLIGFLVGRVGFLGAPKETIRVPWLSDVGLALLLLSFLFTLVVEPALERNRMKRLETFDHPMPMPAMPQSAQQQRQQQQQLVDPLIEEHQRSATTVDMTTMANGANPMSDGGAASPVLRTALTGKEGHSHFPIGDRDKWMPHPHGHVDNHRDDLPDQSPTRWRLDWGKVWGVSVGVMAGFTAGLNMLPYDIWMHKRKALTTRDSLGFMLSHVLGIYATAQLLYLLYTAVALVQSRRVPHTVIRPAWLAGVIWAVGNACQLLVLPRLGYTFGYILCAIGPVVVAALIAFFVFKEIHGKVNVVCFWTAITLQSAGVILMGLAKM
ncbi:unnamed protein product [Vitrella brassicaformis CCMP3155]|uniref:EamA domain-containing protein n=2 Tax=Vitrella brassicaformis TaxID=1169539 RepID=A0A0G4G9Q5_VITBC|nr:unnamed protein product [Vitrella brassicaformis CCMP3155]|eukprot:CEM25253.1 unnamed protein product [Vitrella brassicaformis CCMP3155]